MQRKRLISFITTITCLLLFVTSVYANEDITPPSIVSITANNTTKEVGETASFNIEIEDDFSGVESLFIQWSLKTDSTKSISKQWYDVNNTQQFDYVVPTNTQDGEWQAVYISVNDYANNHKFYYRDSSEELLTKLDFEVQNSNQSSNQDTIPPVVSNVRIVTQNYSAPCDVEIQCDVIDNDTGVKEHWGVVYYSPANKLSHSIGATIEKVSGNTYKSVIHLESKYEKYVFNHIQVYDNADNWKNYTYTDLGITGGLDITPVNYQEDITAPVMTKIEYNKTKINIPDVFEAILDVEDTESGIENGGLACFKAADTNVKGDRFITSDYRSYLIDSPENAGNYSADQGPYLFIVRLDNLVGSNGTAVENKLKARIDFDESEKFRGDFYLDKIILWDNAGNKTEKNIQKDNITVSKIEKEYTLKTSTAKNNYISEISDLPEGSTVLCNVPMSNQIIKKELFDAIKGKDITITFMSIYNGSVNITGSSNVSSDSTNIGAQWIINGKDIVNPTKDIDMTIRISKKIYSKYILPEYKFNEDLEINYWNNVNWENSSEEELMNGIHELQKAEIEKYFAYMKEQGYANTDEYLKKTLEKLKVSDAVVEDIIIMANDYVDYLSIEFANNGVLPCKTIVRIKPEYATRAIFGAKDLSLYFADGSNYDLLEQNIKLDEENYYNFTITHNSEYWLTSGSIEKLAKINERSNSESQSEEATNENSSNENKSIEEKTAKNPRTEDTVLNWINVMIISIIGLIVVFGITKRNKK